MDIEKEIEITVAQVPNCPPDYVPETMENYGTLGGDALIYSVAWVYNPLEERKQKMVKVACTACGQTYHLDYISFKQGCSHGYCPSTYGFIHPVTSEVMYHGECCLCPECNIECQVAHVSRFREYGKYYVISSGFCLTVHNVGGHLAVLSWRVHRCTDKEGQIKYRGEKYEGVMIVGGKPIRLAGHRRNLGGGDYELAHWEAMKKFTIEVHNFNGIEIMPIEIQEFLRTDSANSALDVFLAENLNYDGINVFQYLKLWCKYPNVENLVRCGFSVAVNNLIYLTQENAGYYYNHHHKFDVRRTAKYINWKENRPHLMLGVEKEDMPLLKKYSLSKIMLYSWAKQVDKVKLTTENLNSFTESDAKNIIEFLNGDFHGFKPPLLKTRRYIEKQKEKCSQKGLIDLGYLKDYWEALYKVYGSMDKNLLYPADLKVSHDRTIMMVEEKEDTALSEKIAKNTKKFMKFAFEDKKTGLMITPCRSHADLIKEGKILDHCVGTYAQTVANGLTCIFFIRKISEPDIPYFTLEFKKGKVQQNRGYKNCDRTPEVIVFEKKWLKFIKGVMENGKSNNSSTATRSTRA